MFALVVTGCSIDDWTSWGYNSRQTFDNIGGSTTDSINLSNVSQLMQLEYDGRPANYYETLLAKFRAVTRQDILRVARQYLTMENRTLYALLPTGSLPKPLIESEALREQPIQKFEFANGLRLLVKEDHRLPFVELRAAFKGGVLAETVEKRLKLILLIFDGPSMPFADVP